MALASPVQLTLNTVARTPTLYSELTQDQIFQLQIKHEQYVYDLKNSTVETLKSRNSGQRLSTGWLSERFVYYGCK
jgi:hypothetical protein